MIQEVEYFEIELTECVTMKLMNQILAAFKGRAAYLPFGVFGFGLLLATVSCTVQQNQSLLSSRSNSVDVVTSIVNNTPFAYDVAADTISYNSCVGTALKDSGIPGIKIGVNEGFVDPNGSGAVKGGLKLRSDFLQFVAKNVPPNYPATTVMPSQIQYLLENSRANKGLDIQFAVRWATNLKVVSDTINPSTNVVLNRDGVYEGAFLSQDPVLTSVTKNVQFGAGGTVLSEGPRIYNLASSNSTAVPIEAQFSYSKISDDTFPIQTGVDDSLGAAEQYADIVRSKFNSQTYVLTQTFGSTTPSNGVDDGSYGLNSPQRASSTDTTKAYGRSYELTFTTKNAIYPSQRKNILSKVVERSLEDGKLVSGVSWTCDYVLIMKTNQLNGRKAAQPSCSEIQATDLLNANVAAKVKMIRRHYKQDDWAIGFYYGANTVYAPASRVNQPLCMVAKKTDCYLPTAGLIASNPTQDVGVQYDYSKECYLSRYQEMGVTYVGNLTGDSARALGRCPQYASICVRSSTSY